MGLGVVNPLAVMQGYLTWFERMAATATHLTLAEIAQDIAAFCRRHNQPEATPGDKLRCRLAIVAFRNEARDRIARGES